MAKRPHRSQRPVSRQKKVSEIQAGEEGVLTTEFVLPDWKLTLLHAAIIIAVGLWVYWPALTGDWLWDDDIYITKNPLMDDPARLWKAWFQPGSFMEYYPIQQTVQWFQWQLWHNDTLGYHLTNVLLHIGSALLLWRLFAKLGMKLPWLGGLIFVCHPVNVESVAWIVELKNTLSLPPFLLAMCAWVDYEEHKQPRDYLWALGWFVIAMLCKITMAPFAAVILLYAWWKRGRIGWRDLLASLPFWVIAVSLWEVASSAGASYGQNNQSGSVSVMSLGSPFYRLVLDGQALAFYLAHSILPVTLLPIYPLWDVDTASLFQYLPWLLFAGIFCVLFWKRRTWGRHGLLGLGFFLLNIAPFVAMGLTFHPRDTWVMDHFLYIPVIGLIGLFTAAVGDIDLRLSKSAHAYSTGIITILVVLLAFQARGYANAFTNEETYWSYTLDRNPGSWTAHNNLGKIALIDHHMDEALNHFEAALLLKPTSPEANADLGTTLVEMGRVPEGILQFKKALTLNPNDVVAHNDLGILLDETGHVPEAIEQFQTAIKVQPRYAEAYNNMGNIYLTSGQLSEAAKSFQQAIAIKPDYAKAYNNLGVVLARQGRASDALEQYAKALSLNPGYVEARLNMGLTLRSLGQLSGAITQFQIVLQIDPQNATALNNLAQLQPPPSPSIFK